MRRAARKRLLSEDAEAAFQVLLNEIEFNGPVRGNWPNFGPLSKRNCYHCHLQKGNPTYVAVWRVVDKRNRKIEVTYAGTHEKADYKRRC